MAKKVAKSKGKDPNAEIPDSSVVSKQDIKQAGLERDPGPQPMVAELQSGLRRNTVHDTLAEIYRNKRSGNALNDKDREMLGDDAFPERIQRRVHEEETEPEDGRRDGYDDEDDHDAYEDYDEPDDYDDDTYDDDDEDDTYDDVDDDVDDVDDDDDDEELTVDRKKVKLPRDKVKEYAQKYVASQNRLDQSKEILQSLRELKDAITQPGKHDETQAPIPDPDDIQPDIIVSDEELISITESLQTGDLDDGVAALKQLIEKTSSQRAKQETIARQDVEEISAQTIQNTRLREEAATAIKEFDSKNRRFQNPVARQALFVGVAEELKRDLRNAGFEKSEIAEIEKMGALADAHTQLKLAGVNKIRPYADIIEGAKKRVIGAFDPKKVETSEEGNPVARRVVRKRKTNRGPTSINRGKPVTKRKKDLRESRRDAVLRAKEARLVGSKPS